METVIFIPGNERPYPEEEFFLQASHIGWSRSPFGYRNVVGAVVNTSHKDLDWVRIEFTLVNREAMPVGSTSDCLIHFPINGVWRFQAPVFQADAVGVGAPLISCEYGKIFIPGGAEKLNAVAAVPRSAPTLPPVPFSAPPPPVPAAAPPPRSVAAKPKAMEWTGICITGGVTGAAHHQKR